MALISSRAWPASAPASRAATVLPARVRPLSHSKIAQESRTGVFTLALLLPVGGEESHQIVAARRTLELLPGGLLRKHDPLPLHFQGKFGAFGEIQGLANILGDGDLAFGGNSDFLHAHILPHVRWATSPPS